MKRRLLTCVPFIMIIVSCSQSRATGTIRSEELPPTWTPTQIQKRTSTPTERLTPTELIATATPRGFECVRGIDFNFKPYEMEVADVSILPSIATSLVAVREYEYYQISSDTGSLIKISDPIPRKTPLPCFDDVIIKTPCESPDGRYNIHYEKAEVEGGWVEISDTATGKSMRIPGSFTYLYGRSTFAWSPDNEVLYCARVDGEEGFYEIDLDQWKIHTLLPLCSITPHYGAINPYILADGRVVFVLQGVEADQFPPPGIYIYEGGNLFHRIVEIPVPDYELCEWDMHCFGEFSFSPDGNWFTFRGPSYPIEDPPVNRIVLLGSIQDDHVWDITSLFREAETIQ
jgi:hypothetical protein